MAGRAKAAAQIAAVGIVAALLGLLIWQVARDKGGAAAQITRGEMPDAPKLVLERLDGKGTIDLASYKGRAVVINFWASWCIPCKREAPELERGWQRWKEKGVMFLGVDIQDFKADARRFVARYGITYPNVFDGRGSTWARFGLTGVPETFFVGRNGKLVSRVPQPISREQLDDNIELALAAVQ